MFARVRNTAARVEELATLDPTSGATTVLGTVGTLTSWSIEAAIDNDQDRLFVLGYDAAQRGHLYTLNSITGALLETVPLAAPLDVQTPGGLVLAGGRLYAFRGTSALERQ